jgi:hypothetical protein
VASATVEILQRFVARSSLATARAGWVSSNIGTSLAQLEGAWQRIEKVPEVQARIVACAQSLAAHQKPPGSRRLVSRSDTHPGRRFNWRIGETAV